MTTTGSDLLPSREAARAALQRAGARHQRGSKPEKWTFPDGNVATVTDARGGTEAVDIVYQRVRPSLT